MGDQLVCDLLEEHDLGQYKDIFSEHEIDYSALCLMNEDTIKEIVPKIGHRIKLMWLISNLKSKNVECTPDIQCLSPVYERVDNILLDNAHSSQISTKDNINNMLDYESLLDSITPNLIKEILKEKNKRMYRKLEEASHIPTINEKRALNRILADWLCLRTKGYPTNAEKRSLAIAICLAYPSMREATTGGHELWFQQSGNGSRASGLIEIRVRNWRKKLVDEEKKFIRKSKKNQIIEDSEKTTLKDLSLSLPPLPPEGDAYRERDPADQKFFSVEK